MRNPSGTLLDPAGYTRLTLGPADVPPLGAVFFEEGQHVQIAVANPAAGAWTVRVALPAGSPETFAAVTAFMAGGLGVNVIASRPTYFAGDTAVLAVVAFDATAPVTGAAVTANVYLEGAEGSPIVLTPLDDGVSPDDAGGDGLYTAQLAAPPVGHYLVEAILQSGAAARHRRYRLRGRRRGWRASRAAWGTRGSTRTATGCSSTSASGSRSRWTSRGRMRSPRCCAPLRQGARLGR